MNLASAAAAAAAATTVKGVPPAPAASPAPPTPASRSQTPASAVSGSSNKRLSRAFERLRARSRSKSNSQGGRSRSRPASLAFGGNAGSNGLEDLNSSVDVDPGLAAAVAKDIEAARWRVEVWEDGDGNGDVKAGAEADVEAGGGVPADGAFKGVMRSGGRIEVWNVPGVEIPRSETPVRLGVLPSPAVEEFGGRKYSVGMVEGVLETPKRGFEVEASDSESQVVERGPERDKNVSTSAEQAPTTEPAAVEASQNAAPLGEDSTVANIADEMPPVTPERPKQERKVSALAGLPSQQRARQLSSPQSPKSPFHRVVDDDDELYTVTPTATEARSPVQDKPLGFEDEDELYSSTPIAARMPAPWREQSGAAGVWVASGVERKEEVQAATGAQETAQETAEAAEATREVTRPGTADGELDKQSMVSAEDTGADAEKKQEDFGPSDSRRSSISSLGSPDTVIGRRASMMATNSALKGTPKQDRSKEELPVMTSQATPAGPIGTGPPAFPPKDSAPPMPSAVQQVLQPPAQRTSPAMSPEQQRFMSRSYRGRVPQADDRTMSFTPLARNEDGAPAQESLIPSEEGTMVSVDLTALAGPPTGTPPFVQHPVFRNSGTGVQPSEYEKLRTSQADISTPATASTAHSRHTSGDTTEKRRSNRLSTFFKRSGSTREATAFAPTPPAPNATSDQFGLEDIHQYGAEPPVTEALPPQQEQSKQEKRRSGIWEAFKRSPSISRTNFSRDSSIATLDNTPPQALTASSRAQVAAAANIFPEPMSAISKPRALLQKPQRAVSAASPPTDYSKQNKRFSGLGKLFGRSSTQGHNTPKPNKLTKMQQPSRENSLRMGGGLPVVTGQVANYEAYEAMRRQGINADLAFQHPPADLDEKGIPVPPKLEDKAPPPPAQGWFSPEDQHSPGTRAMSPPLSSLPPTPQQLHQPIIRQQGPPPTIQPPQPRPPQFRRLHSAGFKRGLQQAAIPEAFKPVEASFGRQAQPIGPPPEHEPPVVYRPRTLSGSGAKRQQEQLQQPTLPTQQPYWDRQPPPNSAAPPLRERQFSTTSAGSSAGYQLSPQISGQSAYQRGEWGPATSSENGRSWSFSQVSPVQPRTNSESGSFRQQRMGSLAQEVARSPGPSLEYAEQQAPWAGPPPQGPRRGSAEAWGPRDGYYAPSQVQEYYSETAGYSPPATGDGRQFSFSGDSEQPMPPQSPEQALAALRQQHQQQAYDSYPRSPPPMPQQPQYAPPQPPPQHVGSMMMTPDTPSYANRQMQDIAKVEGDAYPSPPYSPPYTPQSPGAYAPEHHAHPGPQQDQRFYQQPQQPYHPQQPQPYAPLRSIQMEPNYGPPTIQHPPSQPYPPQPPPPRPRAPPHQRNRYYAQPGPLPPLGPPPDAGGGRPLTYQRTPSGFTGRRDDAAVSEQEVAALMRGASYPGQEWVPGVYE
jgi:hypothetical protein